MSFLVPMLGGILVLVVAVWIGTFGTMGAALAARRHHDRIGGFILGVMTGPAGCLWLLARSRRRPVAASLPPELP